MCVQCTDLSTSKLNLKQCVVIIFSFTNPNATCQGRKVIIMLYHTVRCWVEKINCQCCSPILILISRRLSHHHTHPYTPASCLCRRPQNAIIRCLCCSWHHKNELHIRCWPLFSDIPYQLLNTTEIIFWRMQL